MIKSPFVLIEDARNARTLHFREPVEILRAHSFDEVEEALSRLSTAQSQGLHAAGFTTYEAGYGFEPRLRKIAPSSQGPLLCFGLFREPEIFDWRAVAGEGHIERLEPLWSRSDYAERFERVISYIRAGDVYQVNLTFPLHGRWHGDPVALYAALRRYQPAPYGGLVALGGDTILSFSPELFFEARDRAIKVRPMKGTAPRGGTREDDDRLAERLASDEKNRAENLMIVDLLRNDLGRVATLGSVEVTDLYTVELYPTLLQMTSGIKAELRDEVDFRALFRNLFPCGSVTGAPKIRAMEIIRELEDRPRGAYCGSIGHIAPDGTSCFNVAIRTASLSPSGDFVFNVGSGVVYDSDAKAEYEECLLKARFLKEAMTISA